MEDVIIIGCGPIGLYGATLCALHNLKGIVLESREEIGGQLTALYPEKPSSIFPDSIRSRPKILFRISMPSMRRKITAFRFTFMKKSSVSEKKMTLISSKPTREVI